MLHPSNIPGALWNKPPGLYPGWNPHHCQAMSLDEIRVLQQVYEQHPDPIEAFLVAMETGVFATIHDRLVHRWRNAFVEDLSPLS